MSTVTMIATGTTNRIAARFTRQRSASTKKPYMNCSKRWPTMAQQAASRLVSQASLSAPLQTALKNAQSRSEGTIQARKSAAPIVKTVFDQLENRLARNQPTMPTSDRGGGKSGAGSVRVTVVSLIA